MLIRYINNDDVKFQKYVSDSLSMLICQMIAISFQCRSFASNIIALWGIPYYPLELLILSNVSRDSYLV